MNIIKRELNSYMRQTIYWMIGLLALMFISFYKMDGLSSTPGGIDSVIKALPPVLQVFFGGASNINTGIGLYGMVHLYLAIALALHAVILGAHIFAKEERDKTFEFLYVKGVKRYVILFHKMISGILILFTLNITSLFAIYASLLVMNMSLAFMDILPYMVALLTMQMFFFSIALLVSLIMPNNQKAGMIGCGIVFIMIMVSMYIKMGGDIAFIDSLSIFHYTDASYIETNKFESLSMLVIPLLAFSSCIIAEYFHEHRDLL